MTENVTQIHTAEEEAANRAAAELQIQKRRKKRLHRVLLLLVLVLIAGGAYGYYRYQQYQAAQAEAAADVLALADGEELTYGEITEVVGNDITVAVVVEAANAGSSEVNAKAPDGDPTGTPPARDGNDNSNQMPQNNKYSETGETREYEIPVGTDVTSSLGSTTTFAKLKSGNIIGIVTEAGTDNILRIKIVQ